MNIKRLSVSIPLLMPGMVAALLSVATLAEAFTYKYDDITTVDISLCPNYNLDTGEPDPREKPTDRNMITLYAISGGGRGIEMLATFYTMMGSPIELYRFRIGCVSAITYNIDHGGAYGYRKVSFSNIQVGDDGMSRIAFDFAFELSFEDLTANSALSMGEKRYVHIGADNVPGLYPRADNEWSFDIPAAPSWNKIMYTDSRSEKPYDLAAGPFSRPRYDDSLSYLSEEDAADVYRRLVSTFEPQQSGTRSFSVFGVGLLLSNFHSYLREHKPELYAEIEDAWRKPAQ